MNTSVNIYIEKDKINGFRVWAAQRSVKLEPPEEMQMVNSIDREPLVLVALQMVGELPKLIQLIHDAITIGKIVFAFPKEGPAKVQIKTDEQIEEAINLKMDLQFLQADYKRTKKIKRVTLSKRKPTKYCFY